MLGEPVRLLHWRLWGFPEEQERVASLQSSQDIKDGLLVQDKVHLYYPRQSSSLDVSYVISFRLVGILTPDRFLSFVS
jgi:hypothetical protein